MATVSDGRCQSHTLSPKRSMALCHGAAEDGVVGMG